MLISATVLVPNRNPKKVVQYDAKYLLCAELAVVLQSSDKFVKPMITYDSSPVAEFFTER